MVCHQIRLRVDDNFLPGREKEQEIIRSRMWTQ